VGGRGSLEDEKRRRKGSRMRRVMGCGGKEAAGSRKEKEGGATKRGIVSGAAQGRSPWRGSREQDRKDGMGYERFE
jgi:hypothetical protein